MMKGQRLVVSAKYALLQNNNNVTDDTGDPATLAGNLKDSDCKLDLLFAAIVDQEWSEFSGFTAAESTLNCLYKSLVSVKPVSIQELIWRIRMEYRSEQTQAFLETIN